jgi:hypothetical protein
MSITRSPDFLRRVLWADTASCLASGALQLLAIDALGDWLQLPRALLLETGVFLVAYGLLVGWIAMRPVLPRRLVLAIAGGNLGWAAACMLLLLAGPWVQPSALGVAWVLAQAATVLVLARLQWLGLRNAPGNNRNTSPA